MANLPIIKQLLTFWHSGALCTGVPERQRLIKIVNKWCYYILHHSISTCCWNWQHLKSNQWHQRYWWTAICIMPTWLPSCRFRFGLIIENQLTEFFSINREHPYLLLTHVYIKVPNLILYSLSIAKSQNFFARPLIFAHSEIFVVWTVKTSTYWKATH